MNQTQVLSMITYEMEMECDKIEIFLINWRKEHRTELMKLSLAEQFELEEKALKEAGLM